MLVHLPISKELLPNVKKPAENAKLPVALKMAANTRAPKKINRTFSPQQLRLRRLSPQNLKLLLMRKVVMLLTKMTSLWKLVKPVTKNISSS